MPELPGHTGQPINHFHSMEMMQPKHLTAFMLIRGELPVKYCVQPMGGLHAWEQENCMIWMFQERGDGELHVNIRVLHDSRACTSNFNLLSMVEVFETSSAVHFWCRDPALYLEYHVVSSVGPTEHRGGHARRVSTELGPLGGERNL